MSEVNPYQLAQGPAKLATEEDIQRDESGITKPNLHRRIDVITSAIISEDTILLTENNYDLLTEDDYILMTEVDYPSNLADTHSVLVQGVNSYRNTTTVTHDEESDDSEIP